MYGKVVEVTKDDEKFAMKIPKPLGIKENLHETLGAKLRAGKPVTGPKVGTMGDEPNASGFGFRLISPGHAKRFWRQHQVQVRWWKVHPVRRWQVETWWLKPEF